MQQPMLCLLWLHKRIGARPCARARTRSWRSAISSTTVLGEAYVQLTPCCHHWKATGIARSSRYKNEETLSHAARQRQVCGHRGRRLCSQNMVNPRDPRSARGGLSRGSDNGSHLLQQAVVVWEWRRRGPIPSAMAGERRKPQCLPKSTWTAVLTAHSSLHQGEPAS